MTDQIKNVDGIMIVWDRGYFLPLRRAFFRAVYGDLNTLFVEAAAQGKTVTAKKWFLRGADIDEVGGDAVRRAFACGHNRTVAWLLQSGVSYKELPPNAPPRATFSLSVA